MKWSLRLVGVLAVLCSSSFVASQAYAQGAVFLMNRAAGFVDAPVLDLGGTNGVMESYQVVVMFGKAPGAWETSYAASFTSPGYFSAPYLPELTFAKPGETVFCQV